MKRSILSVILSLAISSAYCQCGPYTIVIADSSCTSNLLVVSGATAAAKIVWLKNGVPFDSIIRGPIGMTVAGGNGQGNAADQLYFPSSVFVDDSGKLYVADENNDRIEQFPAGSTSASNGTVVAGGNGRGSQLDQLAQPMGIFIDASGNIFVADVDNQHIDKFPSGSTSATNCTVVAGNNGSGSSSNELSSPSSVWLDSAGYIYVADANNHRVQKFPPNSSIFGAGITVAGGNGYGSAANQFEYTYGICMDRSGNLYVADHNNNRIQMFPPGSTSATNGITVADGNGPGQFGSPFGLSVDTFGNLYVTDPMNNRIQKFPPNSTSATPGLTVAGGNGSGSKANQLNLPNGVFVSPNGDIYIADYWNNRVQKWSQPAIMGIDTSLQVTSADLYSAMVTDTFGCVASSDTIWVNHFNSISTTVSASICQGSNYIFNGQSLSASGTYYDTLTSSTGCDSIIILDLIVNPYTFYIISQNICQGDSFSFNGSSISMPGTYVDTLSGASMLGCDSFIVLNLTVDTVTANFSLQPSSTPHLWYVLNQCTGTGLSYLWNWGDSTSSTGDTPSHIYNSAGYYNICVTATDSSGCSSGFCDTSVYLYKDQSGQMIYVQVLPRYPNGIITIRSDNINFSYFNEAVHFSEALQAPTELNLYDLSGRVVMQQDNFSGKVWNVNSDIASGIYIIQLRNGTNSISKKLMIIH